MNYPINPKVSTVTPQTMSRSLCILIFILTLVIIFIYQNVSQDKLVRKEEPQNIDLILNAESKDSLDIFMKTKEKVYEERRNKIRRSCMTKSVSSH